MHLTVIVLEPFPAVSRLLPRKLYFTVIFQAPAHEPAVFVAGYRATKCRVFCVRDMTHTSRIGLLEEICLNAKAVNSSHSRLKYL